jgi:magnesium transporter
MAEPKQDNNVVRQLSNAVVHTATDSLSSLAQSLGLSRAKPRKPGQSPGIRAQDLEQMKAGDVPVEISCIDFCPQWVRTRGFDDLDAFLQEHREEGTTVRWINVNGLTDPRVIKSLAGKYGLHPLALEDMMHIPQRPKIETFPAIGEHHAKLFMIAQMIRLENERVISEQVSIFFSSDTVLTFQERPGDVWDPIRDRIKQDTSRLRANDASYLVYALLDAIVDHCFPILEQFSTRMEDLEEQVMQASRSDVVQDIYRVKRDLILLGRQIWPMREVINSLMRDDHECVSDFTRTYLRDVYDHAIQLIEILETYRELASGLADTHLTVMGNRMNEVMKVLTIFATIFIPITFVAGVYGMNFDYLPELHYRWAYPTFWGICSSIAVGMLIWFKKRNWL